MDRTVRTSRAGLDVLTDSSLTRLSSRPPWFVGQYQEREPRLDSTISTSQNLLLRLIPAESLHDLGAEVSHYASGQVLHAAQDTPEFVHCPHRGSVVSIVRSTLDGSMMETAMMGDEGLTALSAVLGLAEPTGNQAIVQIAGDFTRLRTTRLRAYFRGDARFRGGVLAFTSACLGHVSQSAVCNRLHQLEERVAKWLLTTDDRVGGRELRLTHDSLSQMLGSHRPGVSIAVNALARDGVIKHARGRIAILDRTGLERRACECYGVSRQILTSLRQTLSL